MNFILGSRIQVGGVIYDYGTSLSIMHNIVDNIVNVDASSVLSVYYDEFSFINLSLPWGLDG